MALKNVSSDEVEEWLSSLTPQQYNQLLAEASAEALRRKKGGYKAEGQMALLFSGGSRECILSGAAGTGKSRACLEYLHYLAMKYPRARLLIVRKLRASLTETGLVTFEDEVLQPGHPILDHEVTRAGRRSYPYANGSEIIVGGVDNSTKIMSSQYDFIYVQEATELTVSSWEALTTRLRNGKAPEPRIIGDCNPDSPSHWIYQRGVAGGLQIIQTTHEDNPVLYDKATKAWTEAGRQYIGILDSLTGVRKERLRYGKWVAAEGAVYEINRVAHFIDRFSIPKSWRRFCAVDFGFHNPFVCGWWAVDPDGRMYLYRYIYRTQKLLEEMMAQIHSINAAAHEEGIEIYICDHDAQEVEMMKSRGFPVRRAYKNIMNGIQAVQARLKIQSDGKPRIMFLSDSLVEVDQGLVTQKKVYTIEQELDSYVWPRTDSGFAVKEVPVKENDHAMDMMRYAVAYIDKLGDDEFGWVTYAQASLKKKEAAGGKE